MASEQEERDEQTAERLKASELAILALLLKRLKEIIRQRRAQPLHAIAQAIAAGLPGAILIGRRKAREAGRSRLVLEAAELGVAADDEVFVGTAAEDLARAEVVAASFARQWARAARKAEREEAEGVEPVDVAVAATLFALARTAATENADAFAHERELAILSIGDSGELRKQWNAMLDARVCPICAAADGTTVRLYEPFPQGEPGRIHPNCRCFPTIVQI